MADSNAANGPSLLDRGAEQARQYAAENEARSERFEREAWERIVNTFRFDFLRDSYMRNPSGRYPAYIENPDKPFPPIEFVRWLSNGDTVRSARFTCQGITFEVEWKYEGGGDRADWDDGWWPRWFVIRRGRWFFIPAKRVQVYGPANVAQVFA